MLFFAPRPSGGHIWQRADANGLGHCRDEHEQSQRHGKAAEQKIRHRTRIDIQLRNHPLVHRQQYLWVFFHHLVNAGLQECSIDHSGNIHRHGTDADGNGGFDQLNNGLSPGARLGGISKLVFGDAVPHNFMAQEQKQKAHKRADRYTKNSPSCRIG